MSLTLFIASMNRISRCSPELEGLKFAGLRITSLLFADDVVLFTSSSYDLQLALGWFATEFEVS